LFGDHTAAAKSFESFLARADIAATQKNLKELETEIGK